MSDATQPANWYTDPTGRHQYRYWNGTEWTDQVADNQVTGTDPPVMPTSGAAPAAGPAPGAPMTPVGSPTPVPVPRVRPPKRPGNPLWAWVGAVGGVALIVGSFLNAASASLGNGSFGVDVDKNYFDGDGPIELVIGIAIAALAVLVATGVLPRWGGWVIFGLGVVGALVAVIDIFDVKDDIDTIESLGGTASIGPALWVCLAGGIIAIVAGLLTFVTARRAAASS
jgi:hypothetical protein